MNQILSIQVEFNQKLDPESFAFRSLTIYQDGKNGSREK